MKEKKLKCSNDFHASKQPIALNSALMNKIVVSDKFEHSDKGFRYFTGYTVDDIIRPLCILLPQMNRCIGKNMTFKIEDCNVLVKYNEILNIIKKMLNIKLRNKLLTE